MTQQDPAPGHETGTDLLALGEVMLRLDPGEGRIRTARNFTPWEGGGEYNVARGCSTCVGMRTAIVTALVDNEIGRLVEHLIRGAGVDLTHLRWRADDGIGRRARNGLNFTERGFGVRSALGVSDRANTAVSQLAVGDVDWDDIFGRGVRWFHTGGVFAALSPSAADVASEAMQSARRHGTRVSYDLNYRPSLWSDRGGVRAAIAVNRRLVASADVVLGNEGHFRGVLGVEGADAETSGHRPGIGDERMRTALFEEFPQLSIAAATVRADASATRTDWSGAAWSADTFVRSRIYSDLEILDRVGGGDGFASGLIYGLLQSDDLAAAVGYGAAHGALAMTTPGDSSLASLAEVRAVLEGGAAARR